MYINIYIYTYIYNETNGGTNRTLRPRLSQVSSVKRDLQSVKRDLNSVKRDLIIIPCAQDYRRSQVSKETYKVSKETYIVSKET
jgi:hypothetical protein